MDYILLLFVYDTDFDYILIYGDVSNYNNNKKKGKFEQLETRRTDF